MASLEPHHRVTLSDHADLLSFQFNLLSLMRTFLQNACDLNSRAKCEQPQVKGKGKKDNHYVLQSNQNVKGKVGLAPAGIGFTCLRVIQLGTGNDLQGLQRAAVVEVKKEVLLLGSYGANPSLQQRATHCWEIHSLHTKSVFWKKKKKIIILIIMKYLDDCATDFMRLVNNGKIR